MKILRTATTVLRNIDNKVLKIRPDTYVEPHPDLFMVEIAVEAGQTITLPTPNITQVNVSHRIGLYDTYKGVFIAESSTTTTPSISRSLLANTEYYIRLNPVTTEFMYNMQIVGNGTAVPTPEAGITSIIVGTPATGNYAYTNTEAWFKFKTTSAGTYVISSPMGTYPAYNYNINWDYINGAIPEVTGVTTWNSALATYTYQFAGSYVIAISGIMPGWSVNNTGNIRLLITKCISWGNVSLKIIDWYGCTAMTTLPIQDSKLTGVFRFTNFCRECTSLVAIPYGLFFGNSLVATFSYAFYNCISLRSIPQATFRDTVNAKILDYMFMLCNKLITLPSKLFEFCFNITSFSYTFSSCTLIANIPADLFYRAMMDIDYSKIAVSAFSNTFFQCHSITSIPSGFFSSPQVDNLGLNLVKGSTFYMCFTNCLTLVSVPEYMFHNQIYCTNSQSTFSVCPGLTVIPKSFYEGCTALLNVGGMGYHSTLGYIYGVFGRCVNLVTIEQDCFKDCISCTDFSYICTSNTALVSVGTNIFDNCLAALTYAYAFSACTAFTTPCANIFHDSPAVTSFYATFNATKIHSDSVGGVYQLDPEIFKFNTLVQDFSSVFSNNSNIVNIPELIFSTCTEVTTFYASFMNCGNFISIPPLLFRYNYKVQGFGATFQGCTSITRIPIITEFGTDYGFFYFNPQVRNFCNTFYNCRLANGEDYYAIPQITFYGNAEVTGIYAGYVYTPLNSFYGTFQGNINLQSIPDYLFLYNSKAQDFSNTFYGCTNVEFTSLPAHLFNGVTNADRFNSTFRDVKLTRIPATLFEDCVTVKSFSSTFYGTAIVSIPAGLFGTDSILKPGPKGAVNSFNSTFEACTFLTSIDPTLFYYNINAITFSRCFYGCTSLVSVPSTLFKINGVVTSVTNTFDYTFFNCTKLENIGTNLFKFNDGVLNFNYTFGNCIKLKLEPTTFYSDGEQNTRFYNKSVTFAQCFYRVGFNALDLYMSYSLSYNGTILGNDDNTAGNYQPQLTRTLLANTNYYIKLTVVGGVDSGEFDILVTGGSGAGTPDAEADCTLLSIGTTLVGESISGASVKWYKFKTTIAGSYIFKTIQNASEIFSRRGTAPDLWNCLFNYTPVKTQCFGTVAGNNAVNISNYGDIPALWK